MTIRQPQPAKWIPVLMYHRVVDRVVGPDPWRLKISAAGFAAQLAHLRRRGFQSIALDDVPAALRDQSPWQKPVAITFDDGYLDTYTHALPLLKKYGFIATIMLVSERIGGQNDWDSGSEAPAPLLALNEIRELADAGMRFGSHGANHVCLTQIGIDDVRRELADSKTRLEQLLGHEIPTLAYPYGRSSTDVRRIAAEVGYVAAFGADHGSSDLHNFSRIDAAACQGDTLVWRLKVSGIYDKFRERRGLRALNDLRKRLLHGPANTVHSSVATSSG